MQPPDRKLELTSSITPEGLPSGIILEVGFNFHVTMATSINFCTTEQAVLLPFCPPPGVRFITDSNCEDHVFEAVMIVNLHGTAPRIINN